MIQASGLRLRNYPEGHTQINCQDDVVELYHNNSKKAETVSGGFTVTGTCTATAFAGDGSNLTNLPSSTDSSKMPLSGGEFTGDITVEHVLPDSNNTRNLGSSSNRFANLFVNDMHFANSADNPNKVDGTWGDWTLQEGEDSIFMLNNRNGKKYKMNLTEIV